MNSHSEKDIFAESPALNYMLKTLYVMALFLGGMWIMFHSLSLLKENISLRSFPYPYQAGLAIANDTEGINTIQEFLAIQKYLCTSETTPWGKGLNLEVGNSIQFYDAAGGSQFTVFDSSGNIRQEAWKVISDFNRAGYIDGLYGEAPLGKKYGLEFPIWYIESPDSEIQLYGENLSHEYGLRYINTGEHTFIIGQDAPLNPQIVFVKSYEWLTSKIFSSAENKDEFNWNNALLNHYTWGSRNKFWRFQRFLNNRGELLESPMEVKYIAEQLTPANLDRLTKSGGYMIVHTRLGSNPNEAEWVPMESRLALQELAARFHSGQILVATTARLLDYNLTVKLLDWRWQKVEDYLKVEIKGLKAVDYPTPKLTPDKLSGLTFYTPSPTKTRIFYQGNEIPVIINPPDKSHRWSVSISWQRSIFPARY